jgi:uncharacterized protein involved in exopolysaccharide biosynthesis
MSDATASTLPMPMPMPMPAPMPVAAAAIRGAVRDLLISIFYHKRAVLLIAAAIVALGVLVAILMPPSYKRKPGCCR